MNEDELDKWLKDNLYKFATPDLGDLRWKIKYKSIKKKKKKLLDAEHKCVKKKGGYV